MIRSSSTTSYNSTRIVMIATTILIAVVVTTISNLTTTAKFGVVEAVPVGTVEENDEELSSLSVVSSSNNDTTTTSMWDAVDQLNEVNDDDKYSSTINSTAVTTVSFNTMDEDNNNYFYDPAFANDHRQLHILSTCPLFRVFFLFLAECECHYPLLDYPLLKGKIDIDCARYVCSPLGTVCSSVNFTTGFKLWPPAIDTGLCIDKVSFFNDGSTARGPFCIGFITRRLRNDCPKGIVNCLQSGKAAKVTKLNNEVVGCNIKIEDELCTSCTPCDNTGGVTFDCSNVVDGFKTSTCAKFPVWLGPGSRSNGILPQIVFDKN